MSSAKRPSEGLNMSPRAYAEFRQDREERENLALIGAMLGGSALNAVANHIAHGGYGSMDPPPAERLRHQPRWTLDPFKQVDAFGARARDVPNLDKFRLIEGSMEDNPNSNQLRTIARRMGFRADEHGVLADRSGRGWLALASSGDANTAGSRPLSTNIGLVGGVAVPQYPTIGTLAHEMGHATKVNPGLLNEFRRSVLRPLGIANRIPIVGGAANMGATTLAAAAGVRSAGPVSERDAVPWLAGGAALLSVPSVAELTEEVLADAHAVKGVGGSLRTPEGLRTLGRYLRWRAPSAATYLTAGSLPVLAYLAGKALAPSTKKYENLHPGGDADAADEEWDREDREWDIGRPWVDDLRDKTSEFSIDPATRDAAIGATLGALPIPTLGAGYVSWQRAKNAPAGLKEQDGYSRTKHFASGMAAGSAAGIAGAVGSGYATSALLRRAAVSNPHARRWAPLLVGGVAGGFLEPSASSAGATMYERRFATPSGLSKVSDAVRRAWMRGEIQNPESSAAAEKYLTMKGTKATLRRDRERLAASPEQPASLQRRIAEAEGFIAREEPRMFPRGQGSFAAMDAHARQPRHLAPAASPAEVARTAVNAVSPAPGVPTPPRAGGRAGLGTGFVLGAGAMGATALGLGAFRRRE